MRFRAAALDQLPHRCVKPDELNRAAMKPISLARWLALAVLPLVGGWTAFGANPFVSADKPFDHAAAKARAEFNFRTTTNGTTIVFRRKRVFSGKTSGTVQARRMKTNGEDCAAVWAGENVIWESAQGVAARLGTASAETEPGSTVRRLTIRSGQARLSTTTTDGKTRVFFNDQEVFSGPDLGLVTTRSRIVGDKAYAAAWAAGRLLWENVPGAAAQLK